MCLFGQEYMSEYYSLSHRLYSCDWPEMIEIEKKNEPKNFQMILIIFMETLKKNNEVMVGKVFSLSLETFTKVRLYNLNFSFILQKFIKSLVFLRS